MDIDNKITVTFSDGGVQAQEEILANLDVMGPNGQIKSVSTEKIREELSEFVKVLQVVAIEAVGKIKNIVPGGPPFQLGEITVGLNVGAEAGVIFAKGTADANLELKFVRV